MSDINDYEDEDNDDSTVDVDEEEATTAQKGADDDTDQVSDADLAEAESLTVTAKQHIREQLEDEVARFLAQGGKIIQVPPDEHIPD